jgi:hypothetical protein
MTSLVEGGLPDIFVHIENFAQPTFGKLFGKIWICLEK